MYRKVRLKRLIVTKSGKAKIQFHELCFFPPGPTFRSQLEPHLRLRFVIDQQLCSVHPGANAVRMQDHQERSG